jgi:hypothetical protein
VTVVTVVTGADSRFFILDRLGTCRLLRAETMPLMHSIHGLFVICVQRQANMNRRIASVSSGETSVVDRVQGRFALLLITPSRIGDIGVLPNDASCAIDGWRTTKMRCRPLS